MIVHCPLQSDTGWPISSLLKELINEKVCFLNCRIHGHWLPLHRFRVTAGSNSAVCACACVKKRGGGHQGALQTRNPKTKFPTVAASIMETANCRPDALPPVRQTLPTENPPTDDTTVKQSFQFLFALKHDLGTKRRRCCLFLCRFTVVFVECFC